MSWPPDGFYYWPDTCHPSLEHVEGSIRGYLVSKPTFPIRIAKVPRFTASLWARADEIPETAVPLNVETLTVHTAVGPAPYVGRPFFYSWRVALGEGNRSVAGPAERELLSPDQRDPETW